MARESMEKLKIEREEENLENVRAEIEGIKNEAMKELKEGGPVEYWPGINPEHLEKSDLEIFDLFKKEEWTGFNEGVKTILGNINQEKNKEKKNSRHNFINWLRNQANNKIAGEQLKEQRQKENI